MKSLRMGAAISAGAAAVLVCCFFNGCSGSSNSMAGSGSPPGTPPGPSSPAVPASKHVVLVMEENQEYTMVVGNTTGWQNLNALIGKGALATNYYADAHPSIPN
jgi:hypothetical protein